MKPDRHEKKRAKVDQSEQLVTLDITGLNQEGQGIGHLDGLTVFINGGLPGDRAEVRIESQRSRYAVASLANLITPSPSRIQPACPVAGRCGGCTLQALDYPAQLAWKRQQVVDALQRIGHLDSVSTLVRPVLGMTDPLKPWHYRSKVQLPVSGTWEHPEIGFYAANSHTLVDTTVCAIQPPVCDAIRETLREHLRTFRIDPYTEATHTGLVRHLVIRIGFATGQVMVGLVLNGDNLPGQETWIASLHQTIDSFHDPELPALKLACCYLSANRDRTNLIQTSEPQIIAGQAWIEEDLLGIRYRLSPLSFFQVNPRQTEILYATVLEMAALTGQETVLDLYCGTGSITLQVAKQARLVIGIEVVVPAVEDAIANARLNKISNVRFIAGRAEDLTQTLPDEIPEFFPADLVIVDPPRKGCERSLIDTLIRINPPRLIYVSCNPATLARDLALLVPAGYRVEAVQPVDLFPWTGHIESIVLMSRDEK